MNLFLNTMLQLLYSHLTPDNSTSKVIGPVFEPVQMLYEEGGRDIDFDFCKEHMG